MTLQAKIDNKSQITVSTTHELNDAVKLNLSAHFGLVSTLEPANKFGIGLEYKPMAW